MNKLKKFFIIITISLFSSLVFAVETTRVYFDTLYIDVPNDLLPLVNENKDNITKALKENNVSQGQLNSIQSEIINAYTDFQNSSSFKTTTPYSSAKDGLNGFCDALADTIPNTQTLQNVWASSWIGNIYPDINLGGGINAGVATLDISSLKRTAEALSIDVGNISNKLVFPTLTADLRIGGVKIPFDAGITFSFIDSQKISALDKAIDPVTFNYFSLGGDFRYCVYNRDDIIRISVSAGGYYTKGGAGVKKDNSSVNLDFNSTTLFTGAQVNTKVLCFIPFIGTRVAFSYSTAKWKAKADWTDILDKSNSYINDAIKWGILPSSFEGSSKSKWEVHPQIYGGLGIDIFCIDLTTSASYDFTKQVVGGAFSIRYSR